MAERPTPAATPRADELLGLLCRSEDDTACIRHVERLPARGARYADWPQWVPDAVRDAFRDRGVQRPWTHQALAADLVHRGRCVVVATGTASGKSLAYQLPGLAALHADPRACVLYLSPTKALAGDQYRDLAMLAPPGVRPAMLDGDTPLDERDWARDHARWVLTNPDMLHRGVLPRHERWGRVLRRLRYVVVDECHAYRGVFGSHVALVLRRLRRLARGYGSDPVFVLASATVADPAMAAERLIGSPVTAVTDDGSPRPERTFVLWEPALIPGATGENGAPLRRSAPYESARMLADLVAGGARTLAFVRSRQGAEQAALQARRRLSDRAPALVDRVAAYRGGYLAEERRALEADLDSGALLGVASTNALELGIDITGLDATVLAGYPGTLASLWQQAGRAGRGGPDDPAALVTFVARDDPLDSYLVHHPEAVFGASVEAAVTDPSNPHILGPHLACAAAEQHLTPDDLPMFGGARTVGVLDDLVERKVLRRRPTGWYLAGHGYPSAEVDLRGGGGGQVAVVESATGRLLGTVDEATAPSAVHPGAVHLHRGESYLVEDLDLADGVALVRAETPEWTTSARSVSTVEILAEARALDLPGGVRMCTGDVRVTSQVVGFLRRLPGGETMGLEPLNMPERALITRGVWYTVPEVKLMRAGVAAPLIPGALHAAEHAAIGLLPLFAGCDRSDIGGLSTACHPDTAEPTVIVYDGFPGGAGFADRGFEVAQQWLTAVRRAVAACRCATGCPSCVQSPKCGNGNQPLDKPGAVSVLDLVVHALASTADLST